MSAPVVWTSQTVMQAIKELACPKGCVKHAAIVRHTGLTGRQVAAACAKLEAHQFLTRETYSDSTVKPGCYHLTDAGRAALEEGSRLTSGPKEAHGKPRIQPNSLRERAWRTLRIRRKASVPELVSLLLDAGSSDTEIRRATNGLQKYLRFLLKAGYVAEMRREAPQSLTSNGAKRFFLTNDTGPLPPVPQISINKVYDQNTGKQHDISK